jgi:hypothetical protein
MRKLTPAKLFAIAVLTSFAVVSSQPAMADAIFKLQATNGSAYVNLTSILDGSYKISTIVGGSPSSGSINVTNDVGGGLQTLTLYYYGDTGPGGSAGSTLTCQNFNFNGAGGGGQTSCSIFDPQNSTYYNNGAKTPDNLTLNSYKFSWTFTGAQTGNFNIAWASFSGTSYDGCLGGTSQCVPTVPEPAGFTLLVSGLISAGLGLRRKRS